jgi:hypothetical protein
MTDADENCDNSPVRPVNFPVEDGQLLTQGEILCREGCSGHDQASDEQKRAETRTINVKQSIEKRGSRTLEQNG